MSACYFGRVEGALQGRLVDEEVVDEELPADVDGDDRRAGTRGRRGHRVARHVPEPRRPGGRQPDAVVERLAPRAAVALGGPLRARICGHSPGAGRRQSPEGPAEELPSIHDPLLIFGVSRRVATQAPPPAL